MNLKNYRNIASDSLLVAQIASALSDRKVLLPSQFIASLLDESAEKTNKQKKNKKTKETKLLIIIITTTTTTTIILSY